MCPGSTLAKRLAAASHLSRLNAMTRLLWFRSRTGGWASSAVHGGNDTSQKPPNRLPSRILRFDKNGCILPEWRFRTSNHCSRVLPLLEPFTSSFCFPESEPDTQSVARGEYG